MQPYVNIGEKDPN